MRGIAGPTIVWDMEATNMPSMRPTKTSRPCRSRPVKAVSVPGCGAVGAAVLIELLGSLVLGGGRAGAGARPEVSARRRASTGRDYPMLALDALFRGVQIL